VAKPAAIATGWHEYVYPWNSSIVGDPSSGVASISVSYIFPLHSTVPAGTMAFVSPFAHVIRLGATSKYSDAVPFPSLPNPVMTSSNIRSMS
jgi:hypothetical protein